MDDERLQSSDESVVGEGFGTIADTPALRFAPQYDPTLVDPLRAEVTSLGVEELRSAADVDAALARPGQTLVFVNSVCGCAAGSARPALATALARRRPDHVVTVFAGMEREAVARAREAFAPHPPSSPQFALLENGRLLHLWSREEIESSDPSAIASSLVEALETNAAESR